MCALDMLGGAAAHEVVHGELAIGAAVVLAAAVRLGVCHELGEALAAAAGHAVMKVRSVLLGEFGEVVRVRGARRGGGAARAG